MNNIMGPSYLRQVLLLFCVLVACCESDFDKLGYWCRPNLFHPDVKMHCVFKNVVVFENMTFAIPRSVGRHATGYGPSNHIEFLELLTKGQSNNGVPSIAFRPKEDVEDQCKSNINLMHVGPNSRTAQEYRPGPLHHVIEDALTSMFRLYEWNERHPVATYQNFAPVQTLEKLSGAMYYNLHSAAFPVCVSYASTGFSEHFLSGQDCPLARRMRDFFYDVYGVEQNTPSNPIITKPRLGFIDRPSNGARGITNIDELMKIATEMGFEVVLLKLAKPFKAVLTEIRKVTVIVGMHGGGMHAVRYLQDGTVFINLPTYQMHADFGWFYRRSAECTGGSVVEWSGPKTASSQKLTNSDKSRPAQVSMRQRQWLRGQSAFKIPVDDWKLLLKEAASLGCHSLSEGMVSWNRTLECANSSHYSTVSSDITMTDPFLPSTKSEFKAWSFSLNSTFHEFAVQPRSGFGRVDALSFVAGAVLMLALSRFCRRK